MSPMRGRAKTAIWLNPMRPLPTQLSLLQQRARSLASLSVFGPLLLSLLNLRKHVADCLVF
jgi:hypothetical protein